MYLRILYISIKTSLPSNCYRPLRASRALFTRRPYFLRLHRGTPLLLSLPPSRPSFLPSFRVFHAFFLPPSWQRARLKCIPDARLSAILQRRDNTRGRAPSSSETLMVRIGETGGPKYSGSSFEIYIYSWERNVLISYMGLNFSSNSNFTFNAGVWNTHGSPLFYSMNRKKKIV